MSNLPNLVQNTCYGFSDGGQKLYLDLMDKYQGYSDKTGERRALFEADRFEKNVGRLLSEVMGWAERGGLYDFIDNPDPEWSRHLGCFFADRWRNNFMEAKQ